VAHKSLGPGLDGILVVAKPPGPTSHDIVALVRRLAATKRVGHGGTLDPFAAGVLPIFLGKATRVVEFHMGDRKAYRATVCFGATSTTDDLEGELAPAGTAPTREAVEAALPGLTGTIRQRPPTYSAIKLDGRRAYAIARSGETPALTEREVTVFRLDLESWDGSDPERPVAVVEVECSAGTYIRALARDLGAKLGGGAYLGSLTRTASGPFRLESATTLDDVRAAAADGPDGLVPLLQPVDTGLDAFPRVALDADEMAAIARGQFVRPRAGIPGPASRYRLVGPDAALVGIAAAQGDRLAPDKVFIDPIPAAGGTRER
jgi:tRNA pseudouridine55 synthase